MDLITRIREANTIGEVCTYSRYDGSACDGLSAVSYGDMQEVRDASRREASSLWLRVRDACGSDYSGGSATLANYREFERMQSDYEEHLLTGFGGYGTYAIYIRLDAPDYLWEIATGLAGYPVVNDEAVSEVEMEWISEAMPDAVNEACNYITTILCPYIDSLDCDEFDLIDARLGNIVRAAAVTFDRWEFEHASAYANPKRLADKALATEEWKELHAGVFAMLMGDEVPGMPFVRVTTENGTCVEHYSPTDPDMEHDMIVALCRMEYGMTDDIVIEIFTPAIHPLTMD